VAKGYIVYLVWSAAREA